MCAWRPKKGEPLSAPMASSSLSRLDQETLAELLKSAIDQGAVRVESSSPASAGIPGPFAALAAVCHRFSEELAHDASVPFPAVLRESVKENLKIIETVFAKWSLDILMITYLSKAVGFQELKGSLGSISSRVLSVRLRQLEALGLLRREVINEHPPRTRYSLTPDGLTFAQLGEPVLLFLRMRAAAVRGSAALPDDDSA